MTSLSILSHGHVKVVCGPATDTLEHLLARSRSVSAKGIAPAVLWLAPSRRAVELLRFRLAKEGSHGFPPPVLTFHDLAGELIRTWAPEARPLTQVQRRLLAENLIHALHSAGQLPHFHSVIETRGFAEDVFALLAELKEGEIWPDQLQAALEKANTGLDLSRARHCARIYRAYHDVLHQHSLYDREGRLWLARKLLSHHGLPPAWTKVQVVLVAGFSNFSRTQHEMLKTLARLVGEMWLALPDVPGDERAELFQPVRRTVQRLFDGGLTASPSPPTPLPPVARGEDSPSIPLSPGGRGESPIQKPPAAIKHLQHQLFRPLRQIERSANTQGLALIEAPGQVGEVRLVARRIRQLLQEQTAPEDILVVVRDLAPYAELVREIFPEYGIVVDIEGTEPLLRQPAIATLLRLLRLPEEDFSFAHLTALLRSTYIEPDWPETQALPGAAERAEVLLRLLGEPRGRDAYLAAVQRWANQPPPALEDEQAEESRRQKTHQLAQQCQPFLRRFLHAWDRMPARATLAQHICWLRRLADDLGLTRTAARAPGDRRALERFWEELEQWRCLHAHLHGPNQPVEQPHFQRMLLALASETGLARTPRGPGRVQVLSAELAAGLQAPHVFLLGLGERRFPRLAPPPLLEESQRQALRAAGLDLVCLNDLLPLEMLLFHRLVSSATQQLTLSYPAVDERGQPLLPSSFLTAVLDCFEPGTVPTEQRRMLIEGYDSDMPLSLAEYRVQAAWALAADGSRWPLPADLTAQLQAAQEAARCRFLLPDHTIYDGLLRDPVVMAELAELFAPDRILSPTALENYIACPFKFFLKQVLRLLPLEEPSEKIEGADRGLTFHRALARLHAQRHQEGRHLPEDKVAEELQARLAEAAAEYAVGGGPASEMLWRLEGQRLQRQARKYRSHWERLLAPWMPKKILPRPELFEAGFGLPAEGGPTPPLVIQVDGLEVRISGRIDRIDIAELPGEEGIGFWVIDYKTGPSSRYTGSDLKRFRKLQLTLYALAAEQVLLASRKARPLGLAYWLVMDNGPKLVLPGHQRELVWYHHPTAWHEVRTLLQRWVVELVQRIRSGQFALKPDSPHCTQNCDYAEICRISQSRTVVEKKSWSLTLPVLPGRE